MLDKLKTIDFRNLTSNDVKELGNEVLSTFTDKKTIKNAVLCVMDNPTFMSLNISVFTQNNPIFEEVIQDIYNDALSDGMLYFDYSENIPDFMDELHKLSNDKELSNWFVDMLISKYPNLVEQIIHKSFL